MSDNNIEDYLFDESFRCYALKNLPNDRAYWEAYIREHPEESESILRAKEIISFVSEKKVIPSRPSEAREVYEKLKSRIETDNLKQRLIKRKKQLAVLSLAASFLLIFGTAAFFIFSLPRKSPVNILTEKTENILKINIPEGQRSNLQLPDGTRVWLNGGSEFYYPSSFSDNHREVTINGEAYFNVSHMKNDAPFYVKIGEGLTIKVLGTEFNVKCYAEDNHIVTTLIKGKIKLIKDDPVRKVAEELELLPNEKATYNKSNKRIEIAHLGSHPLQKKPTGTVKIVKPEEKQEIEAITAWKDDALVFDDETFESIARRMERWFGMKIEVKDSVLQNERFTGKFVNNETIYQILDIFNRSESIKYTTKNKAIIIYKN
ncbi:MAG TPA: FecR family protein [Bacteroidales bacterium]|nr:FecR family protein [Bacteroidales bacterium]